MLSLQDVSAGYGSFQALFDINLEVKAGEMIGRTSRMRTSSSRVERGMASSGSRWREVGALFMHPFSAIGG